jgi:hypothetical protein
MTKHEKHGHGHKREHEHEQKALMAFVQAQPKETAKKLRKALEENGFMVHDKDHDHH